MIHDQKGREKERHAVVKDITGGLPRVVELFESRTSATARS
jgi:hypothetical protein